MAATTEKKRDYFSSFIHTTAKVLTGAYMGVTRSKKDGTADTLHPFRKIETGQSVVTITDQLRQYHLTQPSMRDTFMKTDRKMSAFTKDCLASNMLLYYIPSLNLVITHNCLDKVANHIYANVKKPEDIQAIGKSDETREKNNKTRRENADQMIILLTVYVSALQSAGQSVGEVAAQVQQKITEIAQMVGSGYSCLLNTEFVSVFPDYTAHKQFFATSNDAKYAETVHNEFRRSAIHYLHGPSSFAYAVGLINRSTSLENKKIHISPKSKSSKSKSPPLTLASMCAELRQPTVPPKNPPKTPPKDPTHVLQRRMVFSIKGTSCAMTRITDGRMPRVAAPLSAVLKAITMESDFRADCAATGNMENLDVLLEQVYIGSVKGTYPIYTREERAATDPKPRLVTVTWKNLVVQSITNTPKAQKTTGTFDFNEDAAFLTFSAFIFKHCPDFKSCIRAISEKLRNSIFTFPNIASRLFLRELKDVRTTADFKEAYQRLFVSRSTLKAILPNCSSPDEPILPKFDDTGKESYNQQKVTSIEQELDNMVSGLQIQDPECISAVTAPAFWAMYVSSLKSLRY